MTECKILWRLWWPKAIRLSEVSRHFPGDQGEVTGTKTVHRQLFYLVYRLEKDILLSIKIGLSGAVVPMDLLSVSLTSRSRIEHFWTAIVMRISHNVSIMAIINTAQEVRNCSVEAKMVILRLDNGRYMNYFFDRKMIQNDFYVQNFI